jgi:hypothetical protein
LFNSTALFTFWQLWLGLGIGTPRPNAAYARGLVSRDLTISAISVAPHVVSQGTGDGDVLLDFLSNSSGGSLSHSFGFTSRATTFFGELLGRCRFHLLLLFDKLTLPSQH